MSVIIPRPWYVCSSRGSQDGSSPSREPGHTSCPTARPHGQESQLLVQRAHRPDAGPHAPQLPCPMASHLESITLPSSESSRVRAPGWRAPFSRAAGNPGAWSALLRAPRPPAAPPYSPSPGELSAEGTVANFLILNNSSMQHARNKCPQLPGGWMELF